MKAYRKDGKIIIEISEEAICSGTIQIPGNECRVADREKLLNFITENITESGDTGDFNSASDLTQLIDSLIQQAVELDMGVEPA